MKHLTITLFLALTLLAAAVPASAEIPHYINFQGKATDSNDAPLNGAHTLKFRIYSSEAGGTAIWAETHTGAMIENGIFSALLGGVTPLNIAFDEPYWISIQINDDEELPRQPITSVGYAYAAETLTTPEVPSGVIVMWSGSIADIPEGWALCDGNNGTPDLTDRFVIHADADSDGTNNVGDAGGDKTIDIEHNHAWINREGGSSSVPSRVTLRYASNGSFYASSYNSSGGADSIAMADDDDIPARTYYTSKAGSVTQSIMPKYYALAFIMKE